MEIIIQENKLQNTNEHKTYDSEFEKYHEICIENKDKIEKYSKILTVVVLSIVALLSIPFENVWFILFVICLPALLMTTGTNDRIYNKFPALLSLILIIIRNVYLAVVNNHYCFNCGFDFDNVNPFVTSSLIVCYFVYCVHFVSVSIIDYTLFKNPKFTYTSRISKLDKVVEKHTPYYYAYFYDFTSKENYVEISEDEYNKLTIGDALLVELQQRLSYVAVKSIKLIPNFEGQTDWEIYKEKHAKDIEEFGQSQEEIDASEGKSKRISYKWWFVLLLFIDIVGFGILEKLTGKFFYDQFPYKPNLYSKVALASLIIVAIVSYIEYHKLKKRYSLEDVRLWRDCLIPRLLFYYLATSLFIGNILEI